MESVVENRPIPYFVTEADLLRQVKQSAAEGLFQSFTLLLGKDVREQGVKFEALLGVYTNAVQFARFLETSLSAACINTEFKDLRRMTDGKIQFKVNVPTIARGDGRRPQKQRQYIVLKTCHKHHISAEIELSNLDLELLYSTKETPLDVTEFIGAVKTVTSALQFGMDAIERGITDSVLTVKLRHTPPWFILRSIADPTTMERGLQKPVKADLVAMFKKNLLENSFFLDRADKMGQGVQKYVVSVLSDLMGSVSAETVFRGISTYTTREGEGISGVLETTDQSMRKILAILGTVGDVMMGPAAYAKYVVRDENLVTAVTYGKVMKSFEQFMGRIVDDPNGGGVDDDAALISDGYGDLPRAAIKTALVEVGNSKVVVESLQRMYNDTQFPYPLNKRIQYTYFFPVGLYMPSPKYTTSTVVRGIEDPLYQPSEAWIVNKNGNVLCFDYQNALKVLCHPRIHNPNYCAQALNGSGREARNVTDYGLRVSTTRSMNLFGIVNNYYDGKNYAAVPDIVRKSTLATADFLHPTMNDVLQLEVHPLFDFYAERRLGDTPEHKATHRTCVGNIPAALAPAGFHNNRGRQLEQATRLIHVIDAATMEIVRETAFDQAYPTFCYVIECMIHGQEDKFIMNSDLVALAVETYWNSSGKLAFVNSFYMVKFICVHLGNGGIPKEAYSCYRRVYGELIVLQQALLKLAGHDTVGNRGIGEFVNVLLDPNLLPPCVYNNVFARLMADSNRHPELLVGPEVCASTAELPRFVSPRERMEDLAANFPNLYDERINQDHSRRYVLDLGTGSENEQTQVLAKIFYYVFLPACANGHLCGMGADYEHVALTLGYNGPVFAEIVDGDDDILSHLENGTLRDLIVESEMRPTVDMIRTLATSFLTCPNITQSVRVVTDRDACQLHATHEDGKRVGHTVLVNGFVAFAVSERSRDAAERLLYPIPFNKLYCDPMVAATFSPVITEYVTAMPSQRETVSFNVPPELMAEYTEWIKSPVSVYAAGCEASPVSLSALVAMYTKLSPVSFLVQAKHKMHPGFGMTVVRTDELVAETVMFCSRASTSVFIGQSTVNRREVRADSVTFEINGELATLETGLGYSSVLTPSRVSSVTTDMGVYCQDFFAMFPGEGFQSRQMTDYIKRKIGADKSRNNIRDPRILINAGDQARCDASLPGLVHGQYAVCDVILTPVVSDVTYFQFPNSPRGRASCVASCDAYTAETANRFLFDHSLADPAYEHRSTVNPWASLPGSLADVTYNTVFRQTASMGVYSPARHFFNREEVLKNNRGLYNLITEYGNRMSGGQVSTNNTDVQYVSVNGSEMFLERPCLLLQEAFPALSSSSKAMLDEYMSNNKTNAPVHMNNYMISEVAPMRRLFKIGDKVVY